MSSIEYMLWAIMVTAAVTYMLRALPLLLLRKDIESAWLNSFLYYVPWVVLTAMVIPLCFFCYNFANFCRDRACWRNCACDCEPIFDSCEFRSSVSCVGGRGLYVRVEYADTLNCL